MTATKRSPHDEGATPTLNDRLQQSTEVLSNLNRVEQQLSARPLPDSSLQLDVLSVVRQVLTSYPEIHKAAERYWKIRAACPDGERLDLAADNSDKNHIDHLFTAEFSLRGHRVCERKADTLKDAMNVADAMLRKEPAYDACAKIRDTNGHVIDTWRKIGEHWQKERVTVRPIRFTVKWCESNHLLCDRFEDHESAYAFVLSALSKAEISSVTVNGKSVKTLEDLHFAMRS